MDVVIMNVHDLKSEITRLKILKDVQEKAIGDHFKSPAAIFHTITSIFKGSSPSSDGKGVLGDLGSIFGHPDMISLLSRVVVPFILNKTLFRKSNFIIKTIVSLVSQRAASFINEKSAMSVWDKIKSFIPTKKAPRKGASKVDQKLLTAGIY